MKRRADYLVVGAGSAGCVVAARLAESGARVVLLEAGPRDRHPMIHLPAGLVKLARHPVLSWNYHSDPHPAVNGRSIHWPRGRVLGGSGAINGMAFVRGNPADYDGWAAAGCEGWSYADVLPHFKSIENFVGGDPSYRGDAGPLAVRPYDTVLDLTRSFVETARRAGHVLTSDFNGKVHEGVGYGQLTRAGRFRRTTATAFLAPARARSNLEVITDALATRLAFADDRCVGVEYRRAGALHAIDAEREVILCGGTVNSPQLLQVSGVGPADHLRAIGVPVLHHLPGVGANLIDHYLVQVIHRVKGTVSVNEMTRGWRLVREAVRWAIAGRGALTFGISSAILFCRSTPAAPGPDLQIGFVPASYAPGRFGQLEREPGMTILVANLKPESRGSILAVSPDVNVPPAIRPNYLADDRDVEVLKRGVRVARELLAQSPISTYSAAESQPGSGVVSDADLEQFIRSAGGSMYHPVGTCRMGVDEMAVVDPRLRVRGLRGLRVADASIMPGITAGNTNAPAVMIGEKAARMVLEDAAAAA